MPVNGSGDSSVVPSLPVNFSQASHWLNTMVHPHPGATAEAWRSLVPHSGTYTHAQINRAYSFYIVSYFLLLFLCSLGNTLILAVIGRSLRQWQTSASRYMLVTALADLGALWLGFPVMLWNFGAVFDRAYHKLPRVKQVINAVKPLTGWGQEACMFTSDWLLVMFSLERLLIIISPFRFEPLQRPSSALIISGVLAVLSLACSCFMFANEYIVFRRGTRYSLNKLRGDKKEVKPVAVTAGDSSINYDITTVWNASTGCGEKSSRCHRKTQLHKYTTREPASGAN